jgi:hypothetical protein
VDCLHHQIGRAISLAAACTCVAMKMTSGRRARPTARDTDRSSGSTIEWSINCSGLNATRCGWHERAGMTATLARCGSGRRSSRSKFVGQQAGAKLLGLSRERGPIVGWPGRLCSSTAGSPTASARVQPGERLARSLRTSTPVTNTLGRSQPSPKMYARWHLDDNFARRLTTQPPFTPEVLPNA